MKCIKLCFYYEHSLRRDYLCFNKEDCRHYLLMVFGHDSDLTDYVFEMLESAGVCYIPYIPDETLEKKERIEKIVAFFYYTPEFRVEDKEENGRDRTDSEDL